MRANRISRCSILFTQFSFLICLHQFLLIEIALGLYNAGGNSFVQKHTYPLFPCNMTVLLNLLEMDYSLG